MVEGEVSYAFTAIEVDVFLEALEWMADGHYDYAMMMPNNDEFLDLRQRFQALQTAGEFPASLLFGSSEHRDLDRLLWWAQREELADSPEELEVLHALADRVQQAYIGND